MGDDSSAFERFVALAKRELQADDVRVLAPNETTPEAANVLVARLPDGGHVIASFATEPKDRDALSRRLAMLASTFTDALAAPPSEKVRARPRPATTLHEELKALATRARALDVVVIDTDSPVVWACASVPAKPRARNELILRDVSDRELSSHVEEDSGPLQDIEELSPTSRSERTERPERRAIPAESAAMMTEDPDDDELDEDDALTESDATRRAVAAIRRLPLDGVHKGKHLRHVERDREYYLVLSFAGIYLLCIVFEGDFDELRAERAAADALPRIERLVQALPPLDPDPPHPMGGVVALRGRRRR